MLENTSEDHGMSIQDLKEELMKHDIQANRQAIYDDFKALKEFGEEVKVTLFCTNDMANVIIDRFGREIDIIPLDDEHFRTDVDVVMSDKFLAWVIALGGGVKVEGPEEAVDNMRIVVNEMI